MAINNRLMSLRADLTAFWPGERVDIVASICALPLAERNTVAELLDELAGDEWEMLQMALERGVVSGDWRRSAVRRRIDRLQDLEAEQ